jgi:hypothetical protein
MSQCIYQKYCRESCWSPHTCNVGAALRLHSYNCSHMLTVSLPTDEVSKGVKKSKSLPLQSMEQSFGGLPPPVTSKSQRLSKPQSQSLCYFLPMLNGEPLRTVQVLPAIPSQRRHSATVTEPKPGADSFVNRTWVQFQHSLRAKRLFTVIQLAVQLIVQLNFELMNIKTHIAEDTFITFWQV